MRDVVVVGARCAGASTALLLARAGHRVLLLDRARLPSDTLSTLYIHQPGVRRLADWGVLPLLQAPPIERAVYEVGDVRLAATMPAAYAPRRFVLDWLLVQAAMRAGARLVDGCTVTDLLRAADGRVTGVRARLAGGTETEFRANLVVGADGMRSVVARLAGAEEYATRRRLTCAYYTYWAGVPADFEQYQGAGQWVGAMPTHAGLTLIATYFPQSRFNAVRGDALASYLDAVRSSPLGPRIADGLRADRLHGTGDQRNFLRTAAGPGWALVGDAGHHKDSITARGMTDAFLQAELLAGCVADGDLDSGARRFGQLRDGLVAESYRSTVAVGRLDLAPDRLELLRLIQGSPALTRRYFEAAAGTIPAHELFTPELLARARPRAAGVRWRSPKPLLEV